VCARGVDEITFQGLASSSHCSRFHSSDGRHYRRRRLRRSVLLCDDDAMSAALQYAVGVPVIF